jgi:ubiquinone/menaquinone biosynthesis C-methylase UbiE
MKRTRNAALVLASLTCVGLGAIAAWVMRERTQPSACPYGQRVFLDLPRPFMRRDTLRRLLQPAAGEQVLEIGPGLGWYSLDIAPRLAPGGSLSVLDLQQPMLDELMRRAAGGGIGNIVATQGDAQQLPFANGAFDAAFLVATLGEIPDKDQALREIRRVLKPGGRLVVGEGQPDPHMVGSDDLLVRAELAGLRFEEKDGGSLGYLARFRAV